MFKVPSTDLGIVSRDAVGFAHGFFLDVTVFTQH